MNLKTQALSMPNNMKGSSIVNFYFLYTGKKTLKKTSSSLSRFTKRHIILNRIFSKRLASQSDLKFHNF